MDGTCIKNDRVVYLIPSYVKFKNLQFDFLNTSHPVVCNNRVIFITV